MRKREIADTLVGKGYTRSQAEQAVGDVVEAITTALVAGDTIFIRGFATFTVKATGRHSAHNFQTGESYIVPSRKKVQFRLAQTLRDRINAQTPSE